MSDLLNSASLVMIPSGYKEDVVYSEVPTDGSGDLSFTRASNGTRINSAGLVEVCPWNLLQYSEDFTNAYWSKDVGATVDSNVATAPNGTTTADRLNFAGSGQAVYTIQSFSGANTFSVYLKGEGANIGKQIYLEVGVTATVTLTGEWQRFEVNADNSASVAIKRNSSGQASAVLAWGIQVNAGTLKPYFPTTDRLNVPRLTYQNGGGGCPSLLLEKQSTNICLYSQDISNTSGSYWGDGSSGGTAVATANYATSPDGTQNATRLQLNEGSLYSVWQQVNFTTSSTIYTYSIWMKAVSGTPTIVFLYDGTGNRNITLTNEWVRYTWTFTAGTTTIFRFGLWSSVWGTSSTADILAWGAQCEVSSYPTSYIPTTSSSATRVADACSKTGISSLIGGGVGTWFMDFEMVQGTGTGNPFAFDLSDGSTANRLFLYWGESSQTWNWGGADTAITLPSTLRKKVAVKFSSGTGKLFCNGSLISTLSLSTAFSRLDIGQRFSNAFPMDGKINQAYFLTTSLTDAECQAITTI